MILQVTPTPYCHIISFHKWHDHFPSDTDSLLSSKLIFQVTPTPYYHINSFWKWHNDFPSDTDSLHVLSSKPIFQVTPTIYMHFLSDMIVFQVTLTSYSYLHAFSKWHDHFPSDFKWHRLPTDIYMHFLSVTIIFQGYELCFRRWWWRWLRLS